MSQPQETHENSITSVIAELAPNNGSKPFYRVHGISFSFVGVCYRELNGWDCHIQIINVLLKDPISAEGTQTKKIVVKGFGSFFANKTMVFLALPSITVAMSSISFSYCSYVKQRVKARTKAAPIAMCKKHGMINLQTYREVETFKKVDQSVPSANDLIR